MAISTSSGGGNTTVTITWTAPTAKVSNVLNDAAHNSWTDVTDENGNIVTSWASLTNAQKLTLFEQLLKRTALREAKEYNERTDLQLAKVAVEAENETNYDLG